MLWSEMTEEEINRNIGKILEEYPKKTKNSGKYTLIVNELPKIKKCDFLNVFTEEIPEKLPKVKKIYTMKKAKKIFLKRDEK